MRIKKIIKLRPSISSENVGDQIIQSYISDIMDELFNEHLTVTMPTRSRLTDRNYAYFDTADYRFVCGTNLIASDMDKRKQWDLARSDMKRIRNVVLLGIGWWQYQDESNRYAVKLLCNILNLTILHFIWDSYMERKFKSIQIENIVNTICLTMCGLTTGKISFIPHKKVNVVIETLTDYMQDDQMDTVMMDCLFRKDKKFYLWLQVIKDYKQLERLCLTEKVEILSLTLGAFESVLQSNVDYVGIRLYGKRDIIIVVDNRVLEISKDTNLTVAERSNVIENLKSKINENFAMQIQLPIDNIKLWKEQFNVKFTRWGYHGKLALYGIDFCIINVEVCAA